MHQDSKSPTISPHTLRVMNRDLGFHSDFASLLSSGNSFARFYSIILWESFKKNEVVDCCKCHYAFRDSFQESHSTLRLVGAGKTSHLKLAF